MQWEAAYYTIDSIIDHNDYGEVARIRIDGQRQPSAAERAMEFDHYFCDYFCDNKCESVEEILAATKS